MSQQYIRAGLIALGEQLATNPNLISWEVRGNMLRLKTKTNISTHESDEEQGRDDVDEDIDEGDDIGRRAMVAAMEARRRRLDEEYEEAQRPAKHRKEEKEEKEIKESSSSSSRKEKETEKREEESQVFPCIEMLLGW
jgi:hypothetical protein